jgi:hypothetical protein
MHRVACRGTGVRHAGAGRAAAGRREQASTDQRGGQGTCPAVASPPRLRAARVAGIVCHDVSPVNGWVCLRVLVVRQPRFRAGIDRRRLLLPPAAGHAGTTGQPRPGRDPGAKPCRNPRAGHPGSTALAPGRPGARPGRGRAEPGQAGRPHPRKERRCRHVSSKTAREIFQAAAGIAHQPRSHGCTRHGLARARLGQPQARPWMQYQRCPARCASGRAANTNPRMV